jgi:hypothetical protein
VKQAGRRTRKPEEKKNVACLRFGPLCNCKPFVGAALFHLKAICFPCNIWHAGNGEHLPEGCHAAIYHRWM